MPENKRKTERVVSQKQEVSGRNECPPWSTNAKDEVGGGRHPSEEQPGGN